MAAVHCSASEIVDLQSSILLQIFPIHAGLFKLIWLLTFSRYYDTITDRCHLLPRFSPLSSGATFSTLAPSVDPLSQDMKYVLFQYSLYNAVTQHQNTGNTAAADKQYI